MSSTPPATVTPQKKSKRKSKKAGDGVSSPVDEMTAPLTLTPEVIEPAQSNGTKRENEAIKELSKRERKLKKKINLIEASEEKIKDLSEEEKASTKIINSDERRKISEKPIHLAILKELSEALEIVIRADSAEEKRIAQEKAQITATHAEELEKAIKEAKEEGKKEAQAQADNNLRLLLSFLRTVSVRRLPTAQQASDPADNEAFESALVMVYEASEKGFAACQKLFQGVDEPVKDNSSTWARVKELCSEQTQKVEQESQEETENDIAEDVPTEFEQPPEVSAEQESLTEAPAEDIIVEKEATEETPENIVIPTTDESVAPIPPAAIADDAAANAAAEYLTEAPTEPAPEAPAGVALNETAVNAQMETPAEEAAKGAEEAPKANGEYRRVENRGGRGGQRGHHRGRSDYRGDGYRGRGGPYRGDGRGGYGGGRGGDRPHRGRGEGYTGGRSDGYRGGYRGRGSFHHNQHHQQQSPQPQVEAQGA